MGQAQRLGLLPPKVKWYQISHDSIRILYPAGYDQLAERVGSLILHQAIHGSIDTSGNLKRIPVILQPYTNISNGYVGMAPYISEFYLQPSQNVFELGSLPWSELLSLHEFRHVQQINATQKGFSRFVSNTLGELAFSGLYALAVPTWFREGDAVYAETKFSPQGRGRLNAFLLPLYEKMITDEPWGFYKARRGSFLEITPNDYNMGYAMVTYGNHVFGENVWNKILRKSTRFNYPFNPFGGWVKHYYGKTNPGLYYDAMNWYAQKWKSWSLPDIEYASVNSIRKSSDEFISFEFPSAAKGDVLTAVSTFDRITSIKRIHQNGEIEHVVTPGIQDDPYFDFHENLIVWGEFVYDPRWQRKDKHVLKIYDQNTNREKKLVPEKGYFMPSFNSTGERLIALHSDTEGKHALRILDVNTGAVINEVPNPSNLYFGYPILLPEENEVIATIRDEWGNMFLARVKVDNGEFVQLTKPTHGVIGRPVLYQAFILFSAGYERLDQVFALDTLSGNLYQVSDGKHAHYNPSYDSQDNRIICSEYSLRGYKLVELPLNPSEWKVFDFSHSAKTNDITQESNFLLDSIPIYSFERKRYRQLPNLINFHSIALRVNDPDWGLEVISGNPLQTLELSAGYIYDRNTRSHGPFASFTLGMWYPQLVFGIQRLNRNVETQDLGMVNLTNDFIRTGINIPLVFTGGAYTQKLTPSTSINWIYSKIRPFNASYPASIVNFASQSLTVSNAKRKAYRQAFPSFAQYFHFSYTHQVSQLKVSQFYTHTEWALPGFRKTHYSIIKGELLIQDLREGRVQLTSGFNGVRGFDIRDGSKQFAFGISYGLPLMYPNVGLGNILYTKRIRLQPFYDIGTTMYLDNTKHYQQSLGFELLFDIDMPPVTFGFRFSKLFSDGYKLPTRFEIFIPAKFF